eukprot:TRINITY_DN26472_c0_g1_i1.p1 TRINITY_DN26472_c0_g1~~TRINITY_DN26472_c0_g1_i1.p1  ORF type:complete len:550 (-),score=50.15 TRINITY_DN26472_c0_g1_i1:327-1976(-)
MKQLSFSLLEEASDAGHAMLGNLPIWLLPIGIVLLLCLCEVSRRILRRFWPSSVADVEATLEEALPVGTWASPKSADAGSFAMRQQLMGPRAGCLAVPKEIRGRADSAPPSLLDDERETTNSKDLLHAPVTKPRSASTDFDGDPRLRRSRRAPVPKRLGSIDDMRAEIQVGAPATNTAQVPDRYRMLVAKETAGHEAVALSARTGGEPALATLAKRREPVPAMPAIPSMPAMPATAGAADASVTGAEQRRWSPLAAHAAGQPEANHHRQQQQYMQGQPQQPDPSLHHPQHLHYAQGPYPPQYHHHQHHHQHHSPHSSRNHHHHRQHLDDYPRDHHQRHHHHRHWPPQHAEERRDTALSALHLQPRHDGGRARSGSMMSGASRRSRRGWRSKAESPGNSPSDRSEAGAHSVQQQLRSPHHPARARSGSACSNPGQGGDSSVYPGSMHSRGRFSGAPEEPPPHYYMRSPRGHGDPHHFEQFGRAPGEPQYHGHPPGTHYDPMHHGLSPGMSPDDAARHRRRSPAGLVADPRHFGRAAGLHDDSPNHSHGRR